MTRTRNFGAAAYRTKRCTRSSKPLVQPFLDRANADPLGDHSGIIADMRAAVIPFLKKHNPNLQ